MAHVSVGPQVVASSLDTLEPVLLEGFDSKEDLVACLKASANVPRIAGDPIQLRYRPLSSSSSPPPPPSAVLFCVTVAPCDPCHKPWTGVSTAQNSSCMTEARLGDCVC